MPNYYAGAEKLCSDQGFRLPTRAEFYILNGKIGTLGVPSSGFYWSSTFKENDTCGPWRVAMENPSLDNCFNKYDNNVGVLCIRK